VAQAQNPPGLSPEKECQRRQSNGEHDPWPILCSPDSLEQVLDPSQIHPVPFVKIGFRLTGNNCGQMKDNIGSIGDDRFSGRRVRYIGGKSPHRKRRSGRRVRGDRVGHGEVLHRFAANAQPFRNRFAEFAADHAGRSNHQNIHISLDKRNDE